MIVSEHSLLVFLYGFISREYSRLGVSGLGVLIMKDMSGMWLGALPSKPVSMTLCF